MAKIDSAALIAWLRLFPTEFIAFLQLLREKGVRHYQRPLAVAAVPVALVYFLIYRGSSEQLNRLTTQSSQLEGVVQFAPKFRDLQDRLDAFFGGLPHDKDRGGWLTENVRATLRAEDISPSSFSTAREETVGGFAVVSIRLTCRLTYKELATWIARLERLRYPIHVTKLVVLKDVNDVGKNDVDITVTVIFSKEAA